MFDSGVLSLTTGAGKTYVASRVIKELVAQEKRVLFMADQNELITQPLRSLQRFAGIIAAVEQSKDHASLNARVVVASAQTLIRKARRERFPANHFDYIIQDEAHRGSDRNKEISDYFAGAKVLGMTATPFRAGLRSLSKYFQTVFYDKPMSSLPGKKNPGMIDEGFAPAINSIALPIEIDLEEVKTAITPEGKDYKPEDCSAAIEPYYEAIAKIIAARFKRRHIIAYLPLIASSQEFARILRRHGVTACHVDGGSPDREEIIERFSRGEFCCLCNAGVISIGVDIPIADAMLNLQPMHSPALYQQRAGRVARVLPGVVDDLPEQNQSEERIDRIAWSDKPEFTIFDVLWQNDRLGVMRPESLVCDNPEDAQRMFARAKKDLTPEDLRALHARIQEEKEQQLIAAIERGAVKADSRKGVGFCEAAVVIGVPALADYAPVARWEMEAPSEKQIEAIKWYGIDPASVATKGAAAALCNEMGRRINKRLATLKQLRYLYRINADRAPEDKIPHPERLTLAEAGEVIAAHVGQKNAEKLEGDLARV